MKIRQPRVLTLPGWQNSGPAHWQSRWERLYGDERLEQADWQWPRRGDWMARLDETLLADARPTVLVAHSLGCHLVAAWSGHSRHTSRVVAALLVAPPDTERNDVPPQLAGWRPIPARALPFPCVAVVSTDDPFCEPERATGMAQAWGATLVLAGARGHLNADSGLGDWAEGRELLQTLIQRAVI